MSEVTFGYDPDAKFFTVHSGNRIVGTLNGRPDLGYRFHHVSDGFLDSGTFDTLEEAKIHVVDRYSHGYRP